LVDRKPFLSEVVRLWGFSLKDQQCPNAGNQYPTNADPLEIFKQFCSTLLMKNKTASVFVKSEGCFEGVFS
tara:strand:+ start:182 stop:394 length:213 start_codon:yes stop_codon:yes gene_type:complete